MKLSAFNMVLCLMTLSTVAASPLRAEESRTGVPLPGLESDPAGAVVPQSCTVSVIAGKVTVALVVSTVDPAPALLLKTPLFGWNGPADPYPDRHFPELVIRLDGVPTTPAERFEAFAGKYNITNLITLAQMDPWAISHTPPLTGAHPQHPQAVKALRNVGAIDNAEDAYLAKWSARRLIRIPLKSVSGERVQLEYRARPASAVMTPDQLDTTSREKNYCISPGQLRHLSRDGSNPRALAVTEFTIVTGIDGKPPASVMLTMSDAGRDAAPAYLFLCGPHGRPIARRSVVTRERAEVDDAGILHVLSVVESEKPPG